ncbi:MAG: hypothetical protein KBC57_02685 [Neisseriaceae bacterium]|nr:hypothetical protein [Neisseriaceae bacterium]
MNKWMLLIGIMLSGCIPIRVIPKYNPDIYLVPPAVQGYQKADTIGHTDPDLRWRDLQSCGVRQYNEGRLDLGGSRPGETSAQVIARRDRINGCMKTKGYVIYSNLTCVKNKKPTGLCN